MRPFLVDLLACPECRSAPLELHVLDERPAGVPAVPERVCTTFCGRDGGRIGVERAPCAACVATDVTSGFLFCEACGRFYFVVEGIPRLLGEDFSELLDLDFPRSNRDAFAPRRAELDAYLARVEAPGGRSATAAWNLEDVEFWEQSVYGDRQRVERELERIARSRPDAGNRTYPREQHLFRAIRDTARGGVLIDVGCGFSQTIRLLCDPRRVGYDYVGTDLSVSALRAGRETLAGDFVQCSGERMPFRDGVAAAIVMLGTLHHLSDHGEAVRSLLGLLRPGGLLGMHEVTDRPRPARGSRPTGGREATESLHNEAVRLDEVVAAIGHDGDVLRVKREYSPLRAILARRLAERMRGSPGLTRTVLALDDLFLATAGRLPGLGNRAALLLARKR